MSFVNTIFSYAGQPKFILGFVFFIFGAYSANKDTKLKKILIGVLRASMLAPVCWGVKAAHPIFVTIVAVVAILIATECDPGYRQTEAEKEILTRSDLVSFAFYFWLSVVCFWLWELLWAVRYIQPDQVLRAIGAFALLAVPVWWENRRR